MYLPVLLGRETLYLNLFTKPNVKVITKGTYLIFSLAFECGWNVQVLSLASNCHRVQKRCLLEVRFVCLNLRVRQGISITRQNSVL